MTNSRLHGMVVADAFGIPRQVEYCRKMDAEGGRDFKFRDYSASIGILFETGKLVKARRDRVEELQAAFRQAFRAIRAAIRTRP